MNLKLNYIGIIAAILAFISLALPWWTMSMSASIMGISYTFAASVYPYQATVSAMGVSTSVPMNLWFGWAALALVVIGGVLAIVGSILLSKGKMLLLVGGILALLSIIVFAVGLQTELSKTAGLPIGIGLFGSGSISYMGTTMDYSTYLSFGFWLALVAAILAFIAWMRHPIAEAAPPPPK